MLISYWSSDVCSSDLNRSALDRGRRRHGRRRTGLMATAISANKAELLAIANSVASEKMIDKGIVIEAIEEAIQRAARARYGAENDIRAKLDPQTGDLRLWRVVEVVEIGRAHV